MGRYVDRYEINRDLNNLYRRYVTYIYLFKQRGKRLGKGWKGIDK